MEETGPWERLLEGHRTRFKGGNGDQRRSLRGDVHRTNPDKTVIISEGLCQLLVVVGLIRPAHPYEQALHALLLLLSWRLWVGDFEGLDCSFKVTSHHQGVPYQLEQPSFIQ